MANTLDDGRVTGYRPAARLPAQGQAPASDRLMPAGGGDRQRARIGKRAHTRSPDG